MLPFQNYYANLPTHQGMETMDTMMEAGCSTITSRSTGDKKSAAASKSHSEAERRRRERINAHLRTLRTLLPNTTKTDKASLLAEVVHQIRQLKNTVAETPGSSGDWQFPGESDELRLSYCDRDEGSLSRVSEDGAVILIKVVLCCDDREELLTELKEVMRGVRAKVVKAEMVTIGGRTKTEFLIEVRRGQEDELGMLKRALKLVVEKQGLSAPPPHLLPPNKRQRLSHSHPIY